MVVVQMVLVVAILIAIAVAFKDVCSGILAGGYKPPRATWIGWLLIDVVLCVCGYRESGPMSATFILGFAYVIGATLVLVLSLRYGKGGTDWGDYVAYASAVAGAISGLVLGLNGIGIAIVATSLWITGAPLIKSAYRTPQHESKLFWWLIALATLLSMVRTIGSQKWEDWFFPVSDFAYGLAVLSAIFLGELKVLAVHDLATEAEEC